MWQPCKTTDGAIAVERKSLLLSATFFKKTTAAVATVIMACSPDNICQLWYSGAGWNSGEGLRTNLSMLW